MSLLGLLQTMQADIPRARSAERKAERANGAYGRRDCPCHVSHNTTIPYSMAVRGNGSRRAHDSLLFEEHISSLFDL